MGIFNRRQQEEIETLHELVRQLWAQLDATNQSTNRLSAAVKKLSDGTDERIGNVTAQINELDERLVAYDPDPTPAVPPFPRPTQSWALADRAVLNELRSRLDRLEKKIGEVDERVTTTSTELANQLQELSTDMDDALPESDIDAVLESLHATQQQLANEQARYQIAFRQEIADLTAQLQLPAPAANAAPELAPSGIDA